MNVSRSRVALCANMGKLWAVGGNNDDREESQLLNESLNLIKMLNNKQDMMVPTIYLQLKLGIQCLIHGKWQRICSFMVVVLESALYQFRRSTHSLTYSLSNGTWGEL